MESKDFYLIMSRWPVVPVIISGLTYRPQAGLKGNPGIIMEHV